MAERCTNCGRSLAADPDGPSWVDGLCLACASVPPPEDLPRGFAGRPAGRALLDLVEACERVTTSAEGHDDPAYRQLGRDLAVATSTWRREKRTPTTSEVWSALTTIAGGVADGVLDAAEVRGPAARIVNELPLPPAADEDLDDG